MTTLARPESQIERLRLFAREFADAVRDQAVESIGSNPFADVAFTRSFWSVLVTLVVDPTSVPADVATDPVLAIYATAVANDFLSSEIEAAT